MFDRSEDDKKEIKNLKNKRVACRICSNHYPVEMMLDHSKKCYKISKLKEELIGINNWLIQECEKAQQLKNNVGFDLLIKKNIEKGKANSVEQNEDKNEQMIATDALSVDLQNDISQGKLQMVGSTKSIQIGQRKCPTADFKFEQKRGRTNKNPIEPTVGMFSESYPMKNGEKIKQEIDSNKSIGSTDSHDGSLNKNPSKESLELSAPIKNKSNMIKPSHFREKYKKPSESYENNRLSSDSRTQVNMDGSADSPGEKDHFERNNELDGEGDHFPIYTPRFPQEKGQESIEKSLEPLNSRIVESFLDPGNSHVLILNDQQNRDELHDPPEGIMNLLSDDDDSKSSIQTGKGSKKAIQSKFFSLNKTQDFSNTKGVTSDKEKQNNIRNDNGLFMSSIGPFKAVNEKELENDKLLVDSKSQNQGNSQQEQIPINSLIGASSVQNQTKPFQMDKFKELSKNKNFSTQFFQSTKVEEAKPADWQQGLSRDVMMHKICKEFFEKMIK